MPRLARPMLTAGIVLAAGTSLAAAGLGAPPALASAPAQASSAANTSGRSGSARGSETNGADPTTTGHDQTGRPGRAGDTGGPGSSGSQSPNGNRTRTAQDGGGGEGSGTQGQTAHPSLRVECVDRSRTGYTAVFGYTNDSGHTETIPAGPSNSVTPRSLEGEQTTMFQSGQNPASWSSREIPLGQAITWSVRAPGWSGSSVTASSSSPSCGNGVSLPAQGNGLGAPLGIAISVPVGAAVIVAERRARRKKAAKAS